MNDLKLMLDEEAQKLFSEFGGIDAVELPDAEALAKMFEGIEEDEAIMDGQRLQLIELMHLVAGYFKDVGYWRGGKSEASFLSKIQNALAELNRIENRPDKLVIRYRGFTSGQRKSGGQADDYVVEFGHLMIDAKITATMVQRLGLKMHHLSGRVTSAFHVFSDHRINSMVLEMPGNDSAALNRLFVSLKILAQFHAAQKNNLPITLQTKNGERRIPLVVDEHQSPDPNLTLVAALNNLTVPVIGDIVKKVDIQIRKTRTAGGAHQYACVYGALFDIKTLKSRLIKPPVEINNVQWLVVDREQQVVSKDKAQLANYVIDKFQNAPLEVPRVLGTVYGKDYRKIDAQGFGERIEIAAELLGTIDENEDDLDFAEEVIDNLKDRFDEVDSALLDHLKIDEGTIRIDDGKKPTIIEKIPDALSRIVSFAKRRSATRKKVKSMVREQIDFDRQDFETLSEEFDISVEQARMLIDLIRKCFDSQGRFMRSSFEKCIPEFSRHEKKVFDFLWHYLKETPNRNDRVSFLNALQLLVQKLRQPVQAMRILLDDFIAQPETVRFGDRNALILANLLLRKYNKESNIDIEMTPEEVLLVRDGLNWKVSNAAAELIDADSEAFYTKLKSIRRQLLFSLEGSQTDKALLPPRFLFSLKKEFFIFLALVGGRTAAAILRNSIRLYGDRDAIFFTHKPFRPHLLSVLQHLKVLIRGIARVGNRRDAALLQGILDREQNFTELSNDRGVQHLLGKIFELARQTKHVLSDNQQAT